MSRKLDSDKDTDPASSRWFNLLLWGAILIGAMSLLSYVVYVDRKIDAFHAILRHSPPEELPSGESTRSDLHHLMANPVEGQLVYVPAYSHVYHGRGDAHLLTITLSVRNTSLTSEITVNSVRYFDTRGKEVKSYLAKPVRLPPLATTEVLVDRKDSTGGSGANFLVEWSANQPVTAPIIESVMIDTISNQGISFVCRGSVISEAVSKLGETDSETQAGDSAEKP